MLRGYERAGADAQLHPRADRRRLRRPAPPRVLGLSLRRRTRRTPAQYQRIVDVDPRLARLRRARSAGDREPRCSGASTSSPVARGARTCRTSRRRRGRCRAARAGTTCRRTSRGSACARRSSTARTSSSSAASRNPHRHQDRPGDDARTGCSALLDVLDPQQRARPAHADPPLGRRQGRRRSCRRSSRPCARPAARVLWVCDPMHGNTETTPSGIKTRRFDNIVSELEQAFELHTQARLAPRRRPRRAHGRERHRVHRRRARAHRERPRARLQVAASIRASTTSRRWRWRCGSRGGSGGRKRRGVSTPRPFFQEEISTPRNN